MRKPSLDFFHWKIKVWIFEVMEIHYQNSQNSQPLILHSDRHKWKYWLFPANCTKFPNLWVWTSSVHSNSNSPQKAVHSSAAKGRNPKSIRRPTNLIKSPKHWKPKGKRAQRIGSRGRGTGGPRDARGRRPPPNSNSRNRTFRGAEAQSESSRQVRGNRGRGAGGKKHNRGPIVLKRELSF